MSESSKDKTNLISLIISIISLALIITGTIQVIIPLVLIGAYILGLNGLIIMILGPIAVILVQLMIILMTYKNIKNKGSVNLVSGENPFKKNQFKKNARFFTIVNFFFILAILLIGLAFIYDPISMIILLLAPVLTLIAIAIFREYSN